jgi:hypothetical protein
LCPQGSGAAEITVTHLIDSDAWMVEYELPKPVQELIFVRNQSAFRSTTWELKEGNVEFRRKGDYETVRSLDGEPFDRFSIVAPSLPQLSPKDYSQNYLFTVGSHLLYTGHFIVAENTTDPVEYSLRLTPGRSEGIVVRGRYYDSTTTITDPGDDGLFAYFGGLKPLQDENYIAVLDPGLPDWLAGLLPEYLPRLFDFYALRLGDGLPNRPSIYFSFGDGDSESTHFNGGALLDGTYQLRATGRAWNEPDLFLRSMVPASIAHESVHLWNGHVTSSDKDKGASWMHEGGAEILAWRAMRELDYLSKDEFDLKVGEAYDTCVGGLGGRALMSVAKTGEYQLLYSCGAVIGRTSELSMQQNGSDIFAFWRRLINVAVGSKSFSQQTYFDVLLEMGEDDELVAALQELVFESHGRTVDQLDKVFAGVGSVAPH